MIYVALLGAAAALLFGPSAWKARPAILGPSEAAAKPPHLAPTYQSAIADLAHVRLRLVQTKALDDKARAAIDVLTLALVAGSDA
jgi:hypothetical protein